MRQMTVKVVNPVNDHQWNKMLLDCHHSSIFHSANWARVLAESYRYAPSYFSLWEGKTLKGCLPVMEVKSLLTGRRGVSVTFSDYCGSLVSDEAAFRLLFDSVLQHGRTNGWRYLELRGERFLDAEKPAMTYGHHVIDLDQDEKVMWGRLRDSTARNVKKAIKQGVTVQITQSLNGVRDFYALHCLTRKRHGLPPQPLYFFEKLHEHVISQGLGFTALASQGELTVAAIICLHFGSNAVYKYGASDETYQHLRANNLVMWESMIKCAREGYRSFSLGRTDLDNEGLLSFKNGWGGSKTLLNYHRYDFASSSFLCESPQGEKAYTKLLRKLPVSVLRMLGRLAYRHIG
jgi:hypothetical protein